MSMQIVCIAIYIHMYFRYYFLDRLSCVPASLSFWSLFLAVKYRVQSACYTLEIGSRNDSVYNTGFCWVWPGKVKVIWSAIAPLSVVWAT